MEELNLISTASSALRSLLDKEFGALESKNFEEVEDLQSEKFSLMQQLQTAWDVVKEHKRLASRTSVAAFAHKRLENQELLMETLAHNFSIVPPGAGDVVLFETMWSLSRIKVPGLIQQEHSATIIANGTRILRASDLGASISQQVF